MNKHPTDEEKMVTDAPIRSSTSTASPGSKQSTPKDGKRMDPSDRVRAAFANALASLKADMGDDSEGDCVITSSLKSKIRKVIEEEITERQQARKVLTAASALTSLCDSASGASSPEPEPESDDAREKVVKEKSEGGKKTSKKAPSPRDDVPMTFPQKLMEILEDKGNEHIITWLPHGKAFIIYQKKKFASEVLPRYFKESKYTSFTRKLNRWGFVRVTKGPEIGAYYHKCFQRGNYLLCMQMCCQSMNKSKQEQLSDQVSHTTSTPLSAAEQSALLMHGQMPFPSSAMSSPTVPGLNNGNLVGTPFQCPPTHQAGQPNIGTVQPNMGTVDIISQQLKLLNMTRNHGQTTQVPAAANTFANGPVSSSDPYYSAVIGAAVDALQRSYQTNSADCGMKSSINVPKPAMTPVEALQQKIEHYRRCGVMDPSLMHAIMQQQAAAVAMARAQQARASAQSRQAQQQKSNRNTRAHAA